MIRVAIVESDPLYQDQFQNWLKEYEQQYGDSFQLTLFSDGHAIADRYGCADYDIILMDTELGELSGMETAELIRDIDENVAIVLISNSSRYALQGYHVEALAYLIKPIYQSALLACIDKAINQLGLYRRKRKSIHINL